MKLLTRTLLLFLTAFVLVTAAYAWHSETDVPYAVTGGNIYFDKESGTITDCDDAVTQAVIPAQIDGVSVTSITYNAFEGRNSLTSVEIGANVTSIEYGAFFDCIRLTNINVASGNQKYSSADGVLFNESQTVLCCCPGGKSGAYQIPSSVTSIRASAFESCKKLTSVNIPFGVTSIGEWAFNACTGLTSVEIPNSVTSIGELAFSSCTSLTSVEIPSSVTSIGNGVFEQCEGLTSVKIPVSISSLRYMMFEGCTSLKSVEIPSSVISIGSRAFKDCTNLTSVEIPSSVSSIGDLAFHYCTGLANIEIPDSVTSIGEFAFSSCTSLTSIKIPTNVTSIEEWAFAHCRSLTSVEIPNSITSIGEDSFFECTSLRDVYYSGNKEQWETITGISKSGLISNSVTIHYNDSPNAPEFQVSSAPTVNGHALNKADLANLSKISVPVTASAESAVSVTICVPFFDGSKFVGMGFVTATVDNTTQSVTVPVTGDVSGAEKLKVIFVHADFRPLSAAGFDIAA